MRRGWTAVSGCRTGPQPSPVAIGGAAAGGDFRGIGRLSLSRAMTGDASGAVGVALPKSGSEDEGLREACEMFDRTEACCAIRSSVLLAIAFVGGGSLSQLPSPRTPTAPLGPRRRGLLATAGETLSRFWFLWVEEGADGAMPPLDRDGSSGLLVSPCSFETSNRFGVAQSCSGIGVLIGANSAAGKLTSSSGRVDGCPCGFSGEAAMPWAMHIWVKVTSNGLVRCCGEVGGENGGVPDRRSVALTCSGRGV